MGCRGGGVSYSNVYPAPGGKKKYLLDVGGGVERWGAVAKLC